MARRLYRPFKRRKPSCVLTRPEGRKEILTGLRDIHNSVSMFTSFLPNLLAYLHNSCSNFSAWTKITNDKEILSDVLGVHIECTKTPVQYRRPAQTISEHEHPIMKQEIDKLIEKRVITTARYDPKQIISSIFLRPKRDGSYRLYLKSQKI